MAMRVLVVGGGAREHALVWKLTASPRIGDLFCAPGNAGTGDLATNLPVAANDLDGIVAAAKRERIDLVVIGPEEPLARGLADRCWDEGIRVFGPTAAAARIETSKSWAKDLLRRAGVPVARSVAVTDVGSGMAALADFGWPIVLKADGLAAGKGVVVVHDRATAQTVLTAMLEDGVLGGAGTTVLVEEFLEGPEVSVLALSDGERFVTLPPARDHKRVGDGDTGPNTGGMGAFAPVPGLGSPWLASVERTILGPTVTAMAAEGCPVRGVLYAGLILTERGPVVLEYNARFGDPETQVILPLLDGDLLSLLSEVATGELDPANVSPPVVAGAAVGVVLASGGYPGPYQTGIPIDGLKRMPEDVLVFHAGTRHDGDGRVVTAGGRVLTVVGRGPTIEDARARAYAGADAISFPGMHRRTDIGAIGE